MKIDKEHLTEEIDSLRRQRNQIEANLNATNGAIQFCEHLLEVLKMPKPKKEEVPELKDILPPGAKIVDRNSNEKGEKHGMAKRKKAGNQKATGSKKGSGSPKARKKGRA